MINQFVGKMIHEDQYAIFGSLSQVQSSDIRDCDNRKTMSNGGMAGPATTQPEAIYIFQRLKALGLKQKDLAQALDIEENKISKAKAGERQFTASEVSRAQKWFDNIEKKRNLDSDHSPTKDASEGETTPIISLDLSLSMGPGTPIEDFVEENPIEFDIGLLRNITRAPYSKLRVVRGIGHSMEPKFYTGDRILVDTTERTLSRIDGYYWITLWGAHGLKRLRPIGPGRIQVLSEHEDHEPIEVDADDLTIEGRAIWVARAL